MHPYSLTRRQTLGLMAASALSGCAGPVPTPPATLAADDLRAQQQPRRVRLVLPRAPRRRALARALLADPEIMLLDEPDPALVLIGRGYDVERLRADLLATVEHQPETS